jgi:cobaltochelatase CobS
MDNNIFETAPDIKISVKQVFNIDTDMTVEGFSKKNQFVPELDSAYKFDRDTTLAILAGFVFNKRVLIQGFHGTGKSTHIDLCGGFFYAIFSSFRLFLNALFAK